MLVFTIYILHCFEFLPTAAHTPLAHVCGDHQPLQLVLVVIFVTNCSGNGLVSCSQTTHNPPFRKSLGRVDSKQNVSLVMDCVWETSNGLCAGGL